MKRLVFLFLVFLGLSNLVEAQVKIGENPENLHDASVLELESSSRALVLTRVTTIQMNTIEPLNGALVYNIEEGCVYYYDGNEWVNLCVAENALNISLVDNLDGSYTFTDSNGDTVDFITPFFSVDNTSNPALPSGLIMTRTGNNINFEVGRILGTEHIQNGTVTAATIATDAVGKLELQDNSVGSAEIENESILPEDIEPSTIGNQVLKTDASGISVEWGTLDATNITSEDLTATDASITIGSGGTNAVLTATDIAVNVDGTTIETDATNGLQLADNAVSTLKIADDAVTTDKIGTAGNTDANRILGTDVLGNPVWQTAADLTNFAENVTSTNGSISGVADDAALVTMDLEVNVDETTIEVDATNGLQIIDGGITNVKLDKANIPLSGFGAAAADVDLGTNKLINVVDPTNAQDAATMNYVDTQVSGINTLANGSIYIGDGTNVAQEFPITGDATMTNAGVLTIEDDAVNNDKLDKANIPLSGFGAAAADVDLGTNKLINVVDPTNPQDAATMNYVDTQVSGINTLANGSIYIGDGTNVAQEFPITGDATMTNAGVLTIEDDAVNNDKLDKANIPLSGFGAAAADVDLGTNKLINVVDPTNAQDAATMNYVDTQVSGINTLANGSIYIGDGTNVAQEFPITGDATMTNAGVLTIEDDAVSATKINADVAGTGLTQNGTTGALDLTLGTPNQILSTNGTADDVIWVNAPDASTLALNPGLDINGDATNETTVQQALALLPTITNPIYNGTAGSIFFSDGTTLVENNAQLFWDNLNERLNIGLLFASDLDQKLNVNGIIRARGYKLGDGLATLPSIRFTDDLDTGIYSPNDDQLGLSAGGTEAINIDGSGATPTTTITGGGSLELTGQLLDGTGSAGTAGQVLTSTGTGTAWSAPAVVAMGKIDAALASVNENGTTTTNPSLGTYNVAFPPASPRPNADYIIQLTLENNSPGVSINVVPGSQTINGFQVQISQMLITHTPPAAPVLSSTPIDANWYFTVTDF